MACNICYGHPGCPVCQKDSHYTTCPICEGKPATYYDKDGKEIEKPDYDKLPEKEREMELCDHCYGTGEVESEYTPAFEYDE